LIITHFHPGIVWNAAVATCNELILFLCTICFYCFLRKKYFFTGVFIAAVFLIKIPFIIFVLFFIPAVIKKDYRILLKILFGSFITLFLAFLLTAYPTDWWIEWIKSIFSHSSFKINPELDYRDQGFHQFGWKIGFVVRYGFLTLFTIRSFKLNFDDNKQVLIFFASALVLMVLFFKNIWLTYIIFLIPFQIVILIELLNTTKKNFLILILLCVSLICLNGPFVEYKKLMLKNFPINFLKPFFIITLTKLRTIGFFSIGVCAILATKKSYFKNFNK
jgi:hypothetical protein